MSQPSKNNHEHFLPYPFYIVPVFILLVLGLIDTGYLAYSHYQNYSDITFSSFCAISKAINCDTVSQSPWSILWNIPLAFWGIFAYALYLLLYISTIQRTSRSVSLWYVLLLLSFAYSIAAIFFGIISATKIKAYCLLCLASYCISFSLLFFNLIIIRRFCSYSFFSGIKNGFIYFVKSTFLRTRVLVLVILFVLFKMYLPHYWEFTPPLPSSEVSHGLTEDGNPWIGSEIPEIVIHEYADYLCFQCRKMHLFLRRLIAEYPKKIQLIHHHYPMDHEVNNIVVPEPFHIGSGKMAMIAIYATSKGKFWEMNDALYEVAQGKQSFDTQRLADMTGFSSGELAEASVHPEIKEILAYEIRQGMKLQITGTPTYVINENSYQGSIPKNIFQKIFD